MTQKIVFFRQKKFDTHLHIYIYHDNKKFKIIIIKTNVVSIFSGDFLNPKENDTEYNDLLLLIELFVLIKNTKCYTNIHTTSLYIRYLLNEWMFKWQKQDFKVQSSHFSSEQEKFRPNTDKLKIVCDLLNNKRVKSQDITNMNYYTLVTNLE